MLQNSTEGEQAGQTIDATDKIVTPGFVDLHTHLDAQIAWDPEMRPSSYHGVTTALIGNCGVTFAPVSAGKSEYLAKLMEAVEDIAADAIIDGLPWNWESFGEYLDTVQSLRPTLNVVALAGHSAIRFEAMGDKACDKDVQADEQELARIVELVEVLVGNTIFHDKQREKLALPRVGVMLGLLALRLKLLLVYGLVLMITRSVLGKVKMDPVQHYLPGPSL